MHTFSHALFKSSLFMLIGVIDHQTGTRDLRKLSGLGRSAPLLAGTPVVLSTVRDLFPGVRATATDSLAAREIKGSEEMVTILKRAVQAYQAVPEKALPLRVEGLELRVSPAMVKKSRTRARRSRRPHNDARAVFAEHLIEQLATTMAKRIGADPLG